MVKYEHHGHLLNPDQSHLSMFVVLSIIFMPTPSIYIRGWTALNGITKGRNPDQTGQLHSAGDCKQPHELSSTSLPYNSCYASIFTHFSHEVYTD